MKSNIKGIDALDIRKAIIHRHKKTVFKIREIIECEDGMVIFRFYGIGKNNELRYPFWNAEMFEKIIIE